MNKPPSLQALAIALILAACGRNEPASPALWLDPAEATPLAWHDAGTLIVGYRGSIYRYDLSSRQLGQRLADSYDATDFQHVNCFRPRGGRFAVHRPVVTDESGTRSTAAPAQQRFRHVPDWSQPDKYVEDAEPAISGSINPLDDDAVSWSEKAFLSDPSYVLSSALVLAASSALAGRLEQARRAVQRAREVDPALRVATLLGYFPIRHPELQAKWAEGLRKAGLPE